METVEKKQKKPKIIRIKKREIPKWRFDVLNMATGEVIWSFEAHKIDEVAKKWKADTGNKWLSRAKVVRATTGELNCQFVKCYKINQWAIHDREKGRPPSPASSVASSCTEDYSTCSETETEDTEEDTEEETEDDGDTETETEE